MFVLIEVYAGMAKGLKIWGMGEQIEMWWALKFIDKAVFQCSLMQEGSFQDIFTSVKFNHSRPG